MNALTPQQVRQYMLMAADKIERFPKQFSFVRIMTPDDRGGCGCALGWLGYFAGVHNESVETVSESLLGISSGEFYSRMNALEQETGYWHIRASDCSETLRRYADAYLPNSGHDHSEADAPSVVKVAQS